MRIALLFGVIIAIIAVLFAVQNPGTTEIIIGNVTFTTLTALALIVAFGVGALVGMLFTLPSALKHRKRARVLEKRFVEERHVTTEPVAESRIVDSPPTVTEVRRRDTAL